MKAIDTPPGLTGQERLGHYRAERLKMPTDTTLITVAEVEAMLGVTRQNFYELEANGEFPRRIKISHRVVSYRILELREWIDVRQSGISWSAHVSAKAEIAETGNFMDVVK